MRIDGKKVDARSEKLVKASDVKIDFKVTRADIKLSDLKESDKVGFTSLKKASRLLMTSRIVKEDKETFRKMIVKTLKSNNTGKFVNQYVLCLYQLKKPNDFGHSLEKAYF